jgi:hypothetical protein
MRCFGGIRRSIRIMRSMESPECWVGSKMVGGEMIGVVRVRVQTLVLVVARHAPAFSRRQFSHFQGRLMYSEPVYAV